MTIPVVIIGAGEASRLRPYSAENPKALMELEAGVTIIDRTLYKLKELHFSRIFMVCRHEHSDLFKQKLGEGVQILKTDFATHGNLYSVGIALEHTGREPFVLLMSDHVFEGAIINALLSRLGKGDSAFTLCLDREPSLLEAEEGLKIAVSGEKVLETGKSLKPLHGIDTGVILCHRHARVYIQEALRKLGSGASLMDAINLAAQDGKVEYIDITGQLWRDVDTPRDLERARDLYWNIVRDELVRPEDGLVSRYLNRPISTRISLAIYRRGVDINPLFITVLGFMLALGGAIALASREIFLGGFLVQVSSIIDGVDGELARLLRRASGLGGFLDSILDRVADVFIVMALALGTLPLDNLTIMVAMVAAANSVLVSYATQGLRSIGKSVSALRRIPATRDARLFVVFLASMIQLPFLALYYLAVAPLPFLVAAVWQASRTQSVSERRGDVARRYKPPSPELPSRGRRREEISWLVGSTLKLVLSLLILRMIRPAISGITLLDIGSGAVLTTGKALSAIELAVVIYFGFVILRSSQGLADLASEMLVERMGVTKTTIQRLAVDTIYIVIGLILWAYSSHLAIIPYVGSELVRIASLILVVFLLLVIYDFAKRVYATFRDAYYDLMERIAKRLQSG